MKLNEAWPYIAGVMGPIVAALLAGRTIRRLVMKPFELWAARTPNKFDDQLVKDAESDLGLPPEETK